MWKICSNNEKYISILWFISFTCYLARKLDHGLVRSCLDWLWVPWISCVLCRYTSAVWEVGEVKSFFDLYRPYHFCCAYSILSYLFLLSCFNIINDSGIYAMKNLELFEVNLNMIEKYTEDDIGHLRIKFVNDMVFNEFNCAHDGQSKVREVILVPMLFSLLFHHSLNLIVVFFPSGLWQVVGGSMIRRRNKLSLVFCDCAWIELKLWCVLP